MKQNEIETRATAFLKKSGVDTSTGRSLKADQLTYLEAVAPFTQDFRLEEEIQKNDLKELSLRSMRLAVFLAVSQLDKESREVLANHSMGDHTFRDLAALLKSGGKSKFHLMYHKISNELRLRILSAAPNMMAVPPFELSKRIEKRLFRNLIDIVRV